MFSSSSNKFVSRYCRANKPCFYEQIKQAVGYSALVMTELFGGTDFQLMKKCLLSVSESQISYSSKIGKGIGEGGSCLEVEYDRCSY